MPARPVAIRARRIADLRGLPRWLGEREMGRGEATLVLAHPGVRSRRLGPHALDVLTLNILHSGQRREALEAWLCGLEVDGRLPGILALQETNLPVSVQLARRFGYHLAYYGREAQEGLRFVNGKALLSRLPITSAVHFTYAIDAGVRRAALAAHQRYFDSGPGELDEDRGALRATLRTGGKALDVYSLHHTLGDAGMNAIQLSQLCGLVAARRIPAIVTGDFNANLNLRREAEPGAEDGATATVEAYRERYGHLPTGRPDAAHDPRVRAGLRALDALAPDVFERAPTSVRRLGEPSLSPSEARRRLARGGPAPDSEERWRLQDIADGATLALDTIVGPSLPASGKRFDGIFAAAPWRPLEVEIDRSTSCSDHTPVRALLAR